ncbi:MAG: hypothetical protein CVT63_00810 [Candidatus Anoxymicrobium japonicum]|uniref:Epoxyqueuosine reductase QueH n=1 Tax=Candidatus Anoxymicrobium japonicum TaxID=2013648 RepID=A0A2N3G897_9ACTN|nr:MAG: hypothetical protein CVT63_00810 [Candidatus Anoxymicrobium japonicum]
MPSILLHTCCAPCLIYPLALLEERGLVVTPFFYNPNIHPFREYRARYFAVVDYCDEHGLSLKVGSYEMERFLASVGVIEPPERCARCFALRLSRAAAEARAHGIASFTTTLLVSPHQNQQLIREAGEAAAAEHGVRFVFEDMTSGYREATEKSREAGMYRQGYCGCVYSEKERYQKSDPPRR